MSTSRPSPDEGHMSTYRRATIAIWVAIAAVLMVDVLMGLLVAQRSALQPDSDQEASVAVTSRPPPAIVFLEKELTVEPKSTAFAADLATPTARADVYPKPTRIQNVPFTPTWPPDAIIGFGINDQEQNLFPPPPDLAARAQHAFGSALPLELAIPTLQMDAPVIPVGYGMTDDGHILWHSPGWNSGFLITGSAPGQGGNAIFYGHNNINGSIFRGLDQLDIGDEVIVRNANGFLYYVVGSVEIFPEELSSETERRAHLSYFMRTAHEQLTIMSCWPFSGNSHRVVVVANPAS